MSPDTTPPPEPTGAATGSPGALSGNLVQVPVHVPLSLKDGKTVNVVALLNPQFDDVDVDE